METAYVFVIHDNKDLFTCMLLPPIAIDMDGYQNFENWHDEVRGRRITSLESDIDSIGQWLPARSAEMAPRALSNTLNPAF